MAEALTKADFAGFTKLGVVGGSVQFLDGGQPLGTPVPLVDGVATLPVPVLGGGSHQISASYVGEGAYSASTSAAVTRLVPVGADVGGSVPATLSLSLGAPASFGAFTPGVAKDYTASTTANVISTAGDAALGVSDPSATATGHLVNGAFSLPSALLAGGNTLPAVVKTYAAPVSNDAAAITFTQHIGANDALRTGSYSKTLTFTLSTTTP